MPKIKIDYSNTIIYKLTCKDPSIKYIYVGHTTNFIQKKYAHKQNCDNINNKNELYTIIRDNGGWTNWNMSIINLFNCNNQYEAIIKEQEYLILLNVHINSDLLPLSTHMQSSNNKLIINNMNIKILEKTNKYLDIFKMSKKMSKKVLTKSCEINACKFGCNICDYNTSKKSSYDKHILTAKHKMLTTKSNTSINKCDDFICDNCCKIYKSRVGLWGHKKKCISVKKEEEKLKEKEEEKLKENEDKENKDKEENENEDKEDNENEDKEDSEEKSKIVLDASLNQIEQLTNLVIDMVKQNQELQKQVLELASKPNSIINNTLNQNNNNFNLSFFLNETCKDAMNLTDFVNSLTLSLKDLENTGTLGYEEGISQIFINGLSQLSIDKRPIHCSDVKREKLYIRDKNIWEKDHEHIKKAVRKVANKNVDQICDWVKINPDSQSYINPNNYNSKKNDQYLNMVSKATGGSTKEEEEKRICKVVSNIAKHVEIDKNT